MSKLKDLTGKQFGLLTVIKRVENASSGNAQWLCQCECGNTVIRAGNELTRNRRKIIWSCGCVTHYKDLSTQKFGRLQPIKRVKNKGNTTMWLCKCDCGNECVVSYPNLTTYQTQSCGCYRKEKHWETHKKYNTYDLTGDYGIGYTNNGVMFKFSKDKYELIKDYCWYQNDSGYILTRVNQKQIRLHRFILNAPDNMFVDHINHDRTDNRTENLRLCTNSQNNMNGIVRSNNTSGIIGVHWDKERNKWFAAIKINKKATSLGRYDNLEEAIKVRLQAEKEYYGEFSPQKHLFEKYGIK